MENFLRGKKFVFLGVLLVLVVAVSIFLMFFSWPDKRAEKTQNGKEAQEQPTRKDILRQLSPSVSPLSPQEQDARKEQLIELSNDSVEINSSEKRKELLRKISASE